MYTKHMNLRCFPGCLYCEQATEFYDKGCQVELAGAAGMAAQDGGAEGDFDVFGVPLSMTKRTPDKRRNKLRCNFCTVYPQYLTAHVTGVRKLEWQAPAVFELRADASL